MKAVSQLSQRVQQNTDNDVARRLAADLIHDFNNILNVIGGYLQLMQDNTQSPELAASYLAKARIAVEKGSAATSELLKTTLKEGTEPPDPHSPGPDTDKGKPAEGVRSLTQPENLDRRAM